MPLTRLSKTLFATACVAAVAAAPLLARAQAMPVPQNVVQLSADGSIEVPQDYLTLTLSTTREGADAQAVQTQLKAAIDTALAEARPSVQPGQLDVRSGAFNLQPRYTKEGKISTWNGTAEIVLEGRDFGRISTAAGRMGALTVRQVEFGLSREQRQRVEAQAQAMAIDRFKAKADEIARSFGFSGYSLREVSVNASDNSPQRPRVMAMQAKGAMADMAPVPVEAGKSTVQVTVSGAVQLK